MTTRPRIKKDYGSTHADQLVFAENAHTQTSNCKQITNGATALTALGTILVAAHNAQTAALTRAKGTVAARNTVFRSLHEAVDTVADVVQAAADADPDHAEEIILACGFLLVDQTVRGKQVFFLGPGVNPGEVVGTLPVFEADAMYYVEYSLDQKTYIGVHESQNTHFTITGLPLHAVISVRYRATGRHGKLDWSAPVEYVVTK